MAPNTYAKRAAAEFGRRLSDLGVEDSRESPEALGRRAALAVGAERAWDEALEGVLVSSEARARLGGVSREGLRKQGAAGRVIALRDDRDRIRYPAWQFDPTTEASYPVVRRLSAIFRAAGLSGWTLAAFCVTPQPELQGRSPAKAWPDRTDEVEAGTLLAATRAVAELTR